MDFPDDGSPRRIICFEGIEREVETESRMDDHRSWGGASGDEGRELSMIAGQEAVNAVQECRRERREGKEGRWWSSVGKVRTAHSNSDGDAPLQTRPRSSCRVLEIQDVLPLAFYPLAFV